MVRRWSSLTKINVGLIFFLRFYAIKRLRVFRSYVNYKKFFTKCTWFKRRHLRKLHHQTNWVLYFNILKYWTNEYRISRQHIRFQYKNRFFVNNSIIIDKNQLAPRKGRIFNVQDQWVIASLTRCLYCSLTPKSRQFLLKSYATGLYTHAFAICEKIKPTVTGTPLVTFFNNAAFEEFNIDFLDTDNECLKFIFEFALNQQVEIYKILISLWYQQIDKLCK